MDLNRIYKTEGNLNISIKIINKSNFSGTQPRFTVIGFARGCSKSFVGISDLNGYFDSLKGFTVPGFFAKKYPSFSGTTGELFQKEIFYPKETRNIHCRTKDNHSNELLASDEFVVMLDCYFKEREKIRVFWYVNSKTEEKSSSENYVLDKFYKVFYPSLP